jgi:serine/threonine protein kinase
MMLANVTQNPSSIRTLKEFKDHSEFLTEQAAFTTLTKDGHSPEHIVEYLGSYEQGEVRCIILEFADMGSLDDYFHNITPPASERDTVAFFSSLFQLLKGLMSIHEVGENIVGLDKMHGSIS